MGAIAKGFVSPSIKTYLVIGFGVIGAILLVLGIILSIYGFNAGIELAVFGLIIIIVTVIVFVVATDGVDTSPGGYVYSGPA